MGTSYQMNAYGLTTEEEVWNERPVIEDDSSMLQPGVLAGESLFQRNYWKQITKSVPATPDQVYELLVDSVIKNVHFIYDDESIESLQDKDAQGKAHPATVLLEVKKQDGRAVAVLIGEAGVSWDVKRDEMLDQEKPYMSYVDLHMRYMD